MNPKRLLTRFENPDTLPFRVAFLNFFGQQPHHETCQDTVKDSQEMRCWTEKYILYVVHRIGCIISGQEYDIFYQPALTLTSTTPSPQPSLLYSIRQG